MANLNDKLVDYKSLKENTKLTLGEALAYDKGLAGGYNGDFPLTVATKGNIYRVPATNKFYMCITDYNGSNLTAPNANFEELSVWANRDKLENLIVIADTYKEKFSEKITEKGLINYAVFGFSTSYPDFLPEEVQDKFGLLITFNLTSTRKAQFLFTEENSLFYSRAYMNNWKTWKKIY